MASNSPGQNTTLDSLEGSRAPRIIFLLLFMLASLLGSLFIVIVLTHNAKLRNVQNLLIANLCIVCIIDSLSNMSLVLGALIADDWVFGDFMCKVNNFFMNLTAIETVLLLTALSIDRYFSIRFKHKYEIWLSSYRFGAVVSYLWLHSVTFSIPFLTEAVESTFRPQLHLCAVTGQTSLAFLCTTLLVCFFGPLITIIVFHVINFRLSCKLRYIKQAESAEKNYTQMTNESPTSDRDSHPSYYIVILFILWLVLEFPFIITSYIKLYEYSQEMEQGSVMDYPWEVDATFIWLRFFFSSLFPFITFLCKKEIWQSAKECILCRRNNSVVDMGVVGMASDMNVKKDNSAKPDKDNSTPKSKEKEKAESGQTLAFNVPVLFATSTGICIEEPYNAYTFPIAVQPTSNSDPLALKGKKLDITYPQYDYADELVGDTSDYDSSFEIDQYSSSQPVSSRNVQSTLHRTRSLSDPELNTHLTHIKVVKQTEKHKELSGTSGADSGLDLSGNAGSSLERTRKSKPSSTPANDIPSRNAEILTTELLQNQVPGLEHQSPILNMVKSKEPPVASDISPTTYIELEPESKEVSEKKRHLPPRLKPLDNDQDKVKRKRSKSRPRETSSSVESSPQLRRSRSRSKNQNTENGTSNGKDKRGHSSRSQSAHRVKGSS